MDHIVVDGVMMELPLVFTMPLEVFVGGRIDEFAPTVVDVDLEVPVLNLGESALWEAEVVVQTVTVGCEGVGQHQRVYARSDGDLRLKHTLALRGGHGVGAGLVNGDGGRDLSVAPQIVGQFALHIQDGGLVLAEVAGERDDPDVGAHIDQMQGIDLRAAVLVGMGERVVAICCIGVPVPDVVVADIDGHGGVRREVDGEVEGIDLRAAVCIGMLVSVGSGLGVGKTVAKRPGVCLALDDGDGRMVRVIDGEVEGIDLRAAVGVGMREGVAAGIGVGGPVPDVRLACAVRERRVYRVEDGEVEGVHLRATVVIDVRVGVVAGTGVGGPVPGVGLALGDDGGYMVRVADVKVQGIDLRATVRIQMCVGVCA